MRLTLISKEPETFSRSEKGDGGFTLVEALVSVMIAAVSGVLILCGISLWIKSYEKVETAGNAEIVFEQVYEEIRNGLLCSRPLGKSKIFSEKYGCSGEYACTENSIFFIDESGRKLPLISKRLAGAAGGEKELPAFEIEYELNDEGCFCGELRLLYGETDCRIRRRIEVIPVFAGGFRGVN
ncbi:MAG: type II secretion system protein [Lachnospiraceae bacterium]|nr:type II secretion system protein [Lachnospiraceae bacterium]